MGAIVAVSAAVIGMLFVLGLATGAGHQPFRWLPSAATAAVVVVYAGLLVIPVWFAATCWGCQLGDTDYSFGDVFMEVLIFLTIPAALSIAALWGGVALGRLANR